MTTEPVLSASTLSDEHLKSTLPHSLTTPTGPTAASAKTASKGMDMDKVSAAMGAYMLQGWAMLNDGCPDCNTPLMRNKEATSQICVNCELNPPVDPEETTPALTMPAPVSTPAPTSALPPPPSASLRPTPPQNHRVSVLDPVMEARRALRPVGSRHLGGPSGPAPPSTPPPPRGAAPLPPNISPPGSVNSAAAKLKPVSRPIGQPPALPASPPPPPGSSLMPQLVSRDMRRSPQTSMVFQGSAQPPSTPPPAPPTAAAGPTTDAFPSPPTHAPPTQPQPPAAVDAIAASEHQQEPEQDILPAISEQEAVDSTLAAAEPAAEPVAEDPAEGQEQIVQEQIVQEQEPSSVTPVPVPVPAESATTTTTTAAAATEEPAAEPESVAIAEETEPTTAIEVETTQDDTNDDVVSIQDPVQDLTPESAQETINAVDDGRTNITETLQEETTTAATAQEELDDNDDQEEDKAAESDDDFEDAEEEVYKPTEEEIKERDSKREQSERASRLIGQKMLQGWAMLQDPCPNPSCHGVPLLRNREKKEYCVVCDNHFQREQDLEQGKYTIVSSDLTHIAAASTVAPTTTSSPLPPLPPSAALLPAMSTISTAPSAPLPAPPTSAPLPSTPLSAFPLPPQTPSPAIPPQHITSPSTRSISSPISSPSMGRNQRELLGRVSNSIILPPAQSNSLTMASQQILGKYASEDLDKFASEDEDARKHLQMIRKVGEYSSKSLPPVPMSAVPPTPPYSDSRPMSTYSNTSDHHGSESESRTSHQRSHRQSQSHGHHGQQQHGESSGPAPLPPPPPPPLSPEVQAMVAATHRTIATILVKLEAYRTALEVSDSPKECQVLTNQIKGLMECLKACRETL